MRLVGLFIILLAVGSCRCSTDLVPVEQRLEVALGEEGPWVEAVELDWGELVGAAEVSRTVFVRNSGTILLTVAEPTTVAGLEVKPANRRLAPGEATAVVLRIAPARFPEGEFRERLRLAPEGGETHAEVDLRASIVWVDCEVPEVLDFGTARVGAQRLRSVTVRNPSSTSVTLEVGPLSFVDGEALAFGAESLLSRVDVPARDQSSVTFFYRPSVRGESRSSVVLRAGPTCPLRVIPMVGRAVDEVLVWSPSSVDCGWVAPGRSRSEPVTFTNLGDETVTVSASTGVDGGGVFSLDAAEWAPFVVLPGSAEVRMVECAPPQEGEFDGELTLQRGDSSGVLPLHVSGGGPKLGVAGELDFGLAARVLDAGLPATRYLSLSNVGGPATAPATVAQLEVTSIDIVPANLNTQVGEFRVRSSPATLGVGARGVVTVELVPASIGPKLAALTIRSNDPIGPVSVLLKATVRDYGECAGTLNEGSMEFGVVHATSPLTRRLVFRNVGPETCLVLAQLAPGSSEDFQVRAFPTEVPAGAELEWAVKLTPRQEVNSTVRPIDGVLEVATSSTTTGSRVVALSGAAGPACLALLAGETQSREVHFGGVTPGTSSSPTSIRVVNHCAGDGVSPVFINPLLIRAASLVGDAAFSLSLLSPIAAGGMNVLYDGQLGVIQNGGVAPHTVPFRVAFHPQSSGIFRGALVVDVQQDGRVWKQVVPLRGQGDLLRVATDEFIQGGGDDVDIVLARNETSPSNWQISRFLESSDAFMEHLRIAQSNFRMGVPLFGGASFGWDSRGLFSVEGATSDPVITPATPSPAASLRYRLLHSECRDASGQWFANCFVQGGNHSAAYTVWRAVTEPTASAFNGGGLRPHARLSILTFTDRAENVATSQYGWWNLSAVPYAMDVRDTGDLVKVFQRIKGVEHPELVTWGGLTGLSYEHHVPFSNCPWDPDDGTPQIYATPLLVLKAAMGAMVDEVCPVDPADYPEQVERLAEVASGLKTHFVLSALLDESGVVEIEVDGVSVPASDTQGQVWRYQRPRNEIRFRLDSAPSPGQRVRVRYRSRE